MFKNKKYSRLNIVLNFKSLKLEMVQNLKIIKNVQNIKNPNFENAFIFKKLNFKKFKI
jgi:hypothetical protein